MPSPRITPRTTVVAAGLLAASGSVFSARADLLPPLLEPTPLVLKDGRIAQVAVRLVPFQAGSDQLAPAVRVALEQLGAGLATDCFLTAQAIGHVEPAQAEGGDPLAAHRLERTRAERVQAVLTAQGLPPSAIAAVGDRAFVVREPQVTLWLFMLRRGDGCDGKPIDAAALTAGLPPDAAPGSGPPAQAPSAEEPAGPPPADATEQPGPAPASGSAAAIEEAPAAATASAEALPPPSQAQPSPSAAARTADQHPEPPQVRPPETAAPTDVPPPAKPSAAAAASAGANDAGTDHATGGDAGPDLTPAGSSEAAAARTVEVVFELNSSYLPDGATTQLHRLLATLERGQGWKLELTAAVGSADPAKASKPSVKRYDHWLAERRLNRVADWLRRNAQIRNLALTSAYSEGDASRRVIVRAMPR